MCRSSVRVENWDECEPLDYRRMEEEEISISGSYAVNPYTTLSFGRTPTRQEETTEKYNPQYRLIDIVGYEQTERWTL